MMDREYHRNYSRNYYHKRKRELMEKLGNRCAICGSTENLEFDHKVAGDKIFSIGHLLSHSKAEVDAELEKCQLLCRQCHLQKSKTDISSKLSGMQNPFYNKHGAQHPSSKPCIDIDTGIEYDSATEVARVYGLHVNSVTRVCRGKQDSIHGHRIRYK